MEEFIKNLKLVYTTIILTIKPEEFRFNEFVSKFDKESGCGTMCCIAGWFPKYFPNSGFYWKENNYEDQKIPALLVNKVTNNPVQRNDIANLLRCPSEFSPVCEYLFYGNGHYWLDDEFDGDFPNIYAGDSPSLEEVREAWEMTIKALENYKEKELPYYLSRIKNKRKGN
jgi:hypothetical protein